MADLMQRLAAGFSDERQRLEGQWDRGDDVSTEDLRVALTALSVVLRPSPRSVGVAAGPGVPARRCLNLRELYHGAGVGAKLAERTIKANGAELCTE